MEKYHKSINIFLFLIQILFQSKNQILDNIIRLAGHPYRFNHFSFNYEGDMIIDTEAYPLTYEKKFFGIKNNGKEFFSNEQGIKNYHFSMTFAYDNGRVEGESCFVKIKNDNSYLNAKEFLMGISLEDGKNFKVEFYDFNKNKKYNYLTSSLFGQIYSKVFSIIPDPLNNDTEFNYYISYVEKISDTTYKFYTKIINFNLNSNSGNISSNIINMAIKSAVEQTIISCFFTDDYIYACFYTKDNKDLRIWSFIPQNKTEYKLKIFGFSIDEKRRFYKGIHLRKNIGFFSYFKDNEHSLFMK